MQYFCLLLLFVCPLFAASHVSLNADPKFVEVIKSIEDSEASACVSQPNLPSSITNQFAKDLQEEFIHLTPPFQAASIDISSVNEVIRRQLREYASNRHDAKLSLKNNLMKRPFEGYDDRVVEFKRGRPGRMEIFMKTALIFITFKLVLVYILVSIISYAKNQ